MFYLILRPVYAKIQKLLKNIMNIKPINKIWRDAEKYKGKCKVYLDLDNINFLVFVTKHF